MGTTGSAPSPGDDALHRTPLFDRHLALGGKMVPFAGYEMPVQYPAGILTEHLWTRTHAGLFDVSHMGQCYLVADDGRHETVAAALEALVPADILNLAPGKQRYSQLLNPEGGILDDLMVSRSADRAHDGWLFLVVNAACKDADYAHIAAHLPADVRLETAPHLALLALQGPEAIEVVAAHDPSVRAMGFMSAGRATIGGVTLSLTRSGYTGEDGFEMSVPNDAVEAIADLLLADPRVKPIGLGARDSLRLEAGLCLYGHDIDTTTSPVEAALTWSIQKRRRTEGGFPGFARIAAELAAGPKRLRVGILPEGRQPAREGADIIAADGTPVGLVTSGGFGPSVNGPVAMGYVAATHAAAGTPVGLVVRGRTLPAKIAPMPFNPHRYAR